MKVERNKIVKFCEEYLKVKDFEDYCVNGLQVEGKSEVKKIVTGVSISQKLIEQAISKKADMIMVHHGIFINPISSPPRIKGFIKDRLKMLLENDLNLLGFHLPLDAHPEIGNNFSLCKLLGIKNAKPFYVGCIGETDGKINIDDFIKKVENKLDTKTYAIKAGRKLVEKVGIISGGASPDFKNAKEEGADTYICGDVREEVVRAVEESEINFINAGHYNTEKLGIKNLGELIAKEFDIDVEFVDIPCDV